MKAPEFHFPEPDRRVQDAARERQGNLAKPSGSLGRLERIAIELAGFQVNLRPSVRPAAALLCAADHPVTRHSVSPYPSAVTRAMLHNFAAGGAAANVLAEQCALPLSVLDVGVDGSAEQAMPGGGALILRDADACAFKAGDLRTEDAMSEACFAACVEAGRRAVRELGGLRLLILGEMGIGNTTAAAAVSAALLGATPEQLVGAGTGASGEMLERKRAVVRDALARLGSDRDPLSVLRRVGGRELAALFGAMAESVARRTAVLVDGFIVTAVALALVRFAPAARAGLFFAHRSDERGHNALLEALSAEPLLSLGLRLGEASGALLAYPVLEAACALHARMASFESANVPTAGERV